VTLLGGYGALQSQRAEQAARLLLVAYALVSGLTYSAEGQCNGKHRVEISDLQQLQGLIAFGAELSPDGRTLAYSRDGGIWLLSCGGPRASHYVGRGVVPRWAPDGRSLAFYSGKPGDFQLKVLDVESRHVRQLTHFVGGIDPDPSTRLLGWISDVLVFSWAPDGRYLVFPSQRSRTSAESAARGNRASREHQQDGAPLILTSDTPPAWTLSGIFVNPIGKGHWMFWEKPAPLDGAPETLTSIRVNQLFVVDTHSGMTQQLTADNAGYFNPDWSPSGQEIVFGSNDGIQPVGYTLLKTNIYKLDVHTGKKIALTTGAGIRRMPAWSPDGKWIAYLGGEQFGNQSLFIVGVNGGDSINLTARVDRNVGAFQWDPDSRSLVFHYNDGVASPIARVTISGQTIETLSGPEHAYRALIASRSLAVAWQQSDSTGPAVIRFLGRGEKSSHLLLDLNPQTETWALGEQEVIQWTTGGGDQMEGVLIKPVGYVEGHKYPLIVDAYPLEGFEFGGSPMAGNQAWASRGYAVFWPNERAPHVWMNPFKSEKYDRAAKGPGGWEITVDDIISGVDELIRRGLVDDARMALYGFSNGAGVVNYLVTRTNRFKCAVSVAGALSDWVRPALLETDSWVPNWEGGLNPWHDPDAYTRLSAVFHAGQVTTPMLLADGDDDGDFLLDTIEMYNGLRHFGVDVTLLRYPGQGHGFTGQAMRDFWQREMTFLAKCLNPSEGQFPSTR